MLNFLGGLLDNPARSVGIDPEQVDPNQRWALRGMTLQALGNSLSGGTPFYQGMGSIAEGMDARQAAELKRQQELAALQQQQQLGALFGQDPMAGAQTGATQAAMGAPVAQAGPVGPTPQRGALQQQALQQFNPNRAKADQYRRAASIVAAASPETAAKYIDIADKLDPREEFYAPTEGQGGFFQASKSGQVRGVDGFQPKAPAPPSAIQEYQFAVQQGYKGTFDQWDQARRRAGATNVSVNAEKPFINSIAGDLGTSVADSRDQAIAAQGNLQTIQQIREALPSAITGPGADARIYLARLQSVLGVGGATEQERLANTASVMQGLAQAELNAAQLMKGQGQITEAERAIIRRAAGGEITMTPAEITSLLNAIEKVAQGKIRSHQANVQGLQQIPGMGPLMPFFQGPTGAAPLPGAGTPGPAGIQDAARQELERRRRAGGQ
jgi:hypothetical protein